MKIPIGTISITTCGTEKQLSGLKADKAYGLDGIPSPPPPNCFERRMPRKYQRFLQISIKTLSIPELCPANGNTSTYVPFTRNEGHRVHKTTGPYHTSIASKVLKHIPSRMRDMSKKVFKRKLISVLFEILKDKDDYLDATMITREIKSRNPKPYLLSQVALNRYVFLDFELITHISSFFFFFCFLLTM